MLRNAAAMTQAHSLASSRARYLWSPKGRNNAGHLMMSRLRLHYISFASGADHAQASPASRRRATPVTLRGAAGGRARLAPRFRRFHGAGRCSAFGA